MTFIQTAITLGITVMFALGIASLGLYGAWYTVSLFRNYLDFNREENEDA